jgi:hypothetical protein
MTVGFAVFARHGEAGFRVHDHGLKDRPALVTQAAIPGLLAVLMGRLHYRADLRAGVNWAPAELADSAEANDAARALAVYRERGLDGLEQLEGDFALVIWDAREQRLVAIRDPMGAYPIFYTVHRERITLSTHIGPLLDRLPSRTLNQEYLADYLALALLTLEESADGRTVYQGVQRVLSGSIAVFHLSSGKVEERRYWDWLERQVDPGTDNVERLGEQYLDRLRSAVRTRLRGRTAPPRRRTSPVAWIPPASLSSPAIVSQAASPCMRWRWSMSDSPTWRGSAPIWKARSGNPASWRTASTATPSSISAISTRRLPMTSPIPGCSGWASRRRWTPRPHGRVPPPS